MYTLKFENGSLNLILNDETTSNTDHMIMKQPFRPGNADGPKRAWANSADALTYWNESLASKYPNASNNITIEVS